MLTRAGKLKAGGIGGRPGSISEKELFKRPLFEYVFVVYMAVMLAHGAIPYLKFGLWLLLPITAFLSREDFFNGALRGCAVSSGGRYAPRTKGILLLVLLWYGAFFAWVWLSQQWEYFHVSDSEVIATMLRILVAAASLGLYLTDRSRLLSVLKLFMIAVSYFAVVFIVTSPVSTWGTTDMGGITNQFRNFSSYLCALNVLIALYFLLEEGRSPLCTVCLCISVLLVFLAGSRGGLLSLGVMVFLYLFISRSVSRKLLCTCAIVIIAAVCIYALISNAYLQETYGERLMAVFDDSIEDGSRDDRAQYIEWAMEMFQQRPLCGWGVSNFEQYIYVFKGYSRAVYSHCNFAEILSCYGLVGFVLYYWAYVPMIVVQFKNRLDDPLSKLFLVMMVRFIVFDRSTIAFSHIGYIVTLTIVFAHTAMLVREWKALKAGQKSEKPRRVSVLGRRTTVDG